MNRRTFLKSGAAGLLLPLAPAIVKAEWMMPVKSVRRDISGRYIGAFSDFAALHAHPAREGDYALILPSPSPRERGIYCRNGDSWVRGNAISRQPALSQRIAQTATVTCRQYTLAAHRLSDADIQHAACKCCQPASIPCV